MDMGNRISHYFWMFALICVVLFALISIGMPGVVLPI